MLKDYLTNLNETSSHLDAREESYYKHLDTLIKQYAELRGIEDVDVTIIPKRTEVGNPDFCVWGGKNHKIGYIEAKAPTTENLDYIENTEQLERYRTTFPNVMLTNFYEFRLYRNGEKIAQTTIGRPFIAHKLKLPPPVENVAEFDKLMEKFFSFSLPKIQSARSLAVELAKRTRFLRDEVILVEIEEEKSQGHRALMGFYDAFKQYLIGTLTKQQFVDLYAQTITYGLFAARMRASSDNSDFNRKIAFDYIPRTIGILRDIFRYISLEELPKSIAVIVDDIAEVLQTTDVKKILHQYYESGKGGDPIVHFYETFLETYDPEIRERRGVYYTPEAVVRYIVRSVHELLKTRFGLADGLASEEVKLLDPAAGTLSFPAEAIKIAAKEYEEKYGEGALSQWIKNHILQNFYAFELMMAPYAIGHLKISFILEELGYKMSENERFKYYLTNTLEMEEIGTTNIPALSSLSEESHLAKEVKEKQPILVIIGNPPYSGISANINEWTEHLLKDDIDGCQSYYKVDGKPLGEKNPKWLQDDYVKFIRFAQWKIQRSGFGIVGMITNHSYLDNPTFRGMRQSLMKTFDEIYILNLHGNSLKKETAPDGGKDENVFDIRQGVAISIFVKNKNPKSPQVFYADLFGLREEKYRWLNEHSFDVKNYQKIEPQSPYYFFVLRETKGIRNYLRWKKITEIFPINSVGIVTSRDTFVIDFRPENLKNRILQFINLSQPEELIAQTFKLKNKRNWNIKDARKSLSNIDNINDYIKKILYRPFDERYVFYHKDVIERMRYDVMRHMLEGENIGIVTRRQQLPERPCNYFFISEYIISDGLIRSDNKGSESLFPLYIYPDKDKENLVDQHQTEREPNISPEVFEKLATTYGRKPAPEDILYYIYAVFYSNIYRKKYAEFLKIDFPRVPFTADYKIFNRMGELGKELVDLHLLRSPLLDVPIAKYRGIGDNNKIEKVKYDEAQKRIYINDDKYFDNVAPEVWNYHIGGYQVLRKYLRDRKGRVMDDAPRYCRIITAIQKTIE
ncbi:N-6 DNA methylase, partial [bacterium]|nr:N-6 DNA methylase [bacterium]